MLVMYSAAAFHAAVKSLFVLEDRRNSTFLFLIFTTLLQ